jgi:aspartyl-tRNA(Asn)/glutamyl-tRNA(Gln) amidotransferase subunit C
LNTIDRKTVLEISNLAALDLTEAEAEIMERDLSKIIGYFEKLGEIDTSSLQPTFHPLDVACPERADEEATRNRLEAGSAGGAAPRCGGDFFIVPTR